MDNDTAEVIKAMAKAHDTLSVQVAALVAIVGAMSEKQKPDVERIDAWCHAISVHSDPETGVPEKEVRKVARDLLLGIDPSKMN